MKRPERSFSIEDLSTVNGGASRRLYESLGPGFNSHTSVLLSDPLPHGTTYAQAHDLVQRYNAPTHAVLYGRGNAQDDTSAHVISPPSVLGGVGPLPLGYVDVEHGDGWVRNTTGNLRPDYRDHPVEYAHTMVGTITRSVVMDDDGRYRVMTVGEGEGGDYGSGVARHPLNNYLGPEAFSEVDRLMIARAETEQMDRFTQDDIDGRHAGHYGAFGEDPINAPRPIEGGEPVPDPPIPQGEEQ